MNWIHQTIAEFGISVGIPSLELGPENQVRLAISSGGEIRIDYLPELRPSMILVSRSQPLEPEFSTQMRRALRLTDFKSCDYLTVQAAIRNEEMILAMRIPEQNLTLSALESVLSQLTQMHRSIFNRTS